MFQYFFAVFGQSCSKADPKILPNHKPCKQRKKSMPLLTSGPYLTHIRKHLMFSFIFRPGFDPYSGSNLQWCLGHSNSSKALANASFSVLAAARRCCLVLFFFASCFFLYFLDSTLSAVKVSKAPSQVNSSHWTTKENSKKWGPKE